MAQMVAQRRKSSRSAAPASEPPSEIGLDHTSAFSNGHQFSAVPLLRPQAKMAVSQPEDPAELEAEKTADEVMRTETTFSDDAGRKTSDELADGAVAARQVMRDPVPAAAPSADPNAPTPALAAPQTDPSAPAGDPLKTGAGSGGSTTITVTPSTRSLSAPSLSQLWDVMTNSGTRESASVLPKFQPEPQYEYDGNNNVTKATITVTATKEMPQWQELPTQCLPIAAEWNRFYGVIDTHENNHLAIDKKHFTNLHTKLIGKPQATAWKMVDDEIDAADKENEAYDATSNHGVNEGANINTAVQCAPEKVKSTDAGGPGNAPTNPDPMADPTSPSALPPSAQAKLTVSRPTDPAEQEADHMADHVLRMPTPILQRACAGPGKCDCDECQAKHANQVAREASRNDDHAGDVSPVVAAGLSGGGHPLDDASRSYLEPRFGHDFSRVRVHTDARAAQSADAVAARAYAVGGDVVFGAGQYQPGTTDGRRLLAHELTHTIQQGAAAQVQRVGVNSQPDPNAPPPTPSTLPALPGAPAAPAGPIPPGQHDDQQIGTWGVLWKTKLKAVKRDARDFDTLATANTYSASIAAAAVFKEDAKFVVYHLNYTSLTHFTYDNAKINESDTIVDVMTIAGVQSVITEDGVVLLPHQLKGADGATKDDSGSWMEAKDGGKPDDDPFAAHKGAFGAGLGSVTDREAFLKQFEVAMRDSAITALDRSQKDAEQKKKEMSGGVLPAADKENIAKTAKRLVDVETRLKAAERIDTRHRGPDAEEEHDKDEADKAVKVKDLTEERAKIRLEYPILSQVDAEDFLKKNEQEQAGMLGGAADEVLGNIKTTRDNVLTGSLTLWAVPSIVQATQAGLGVTDDGRKKWVAEKVYQQGKADKEVQQALGVFQIVFSLAAIAIGGPVGAAFAVGALGVSMADALITTQQVAQDQAAAGTDINKDKALIPADLTGRWADLVVAWVGVGLSFADASYWVRNIKAGAVTADEATATLAKEERYKGLDTAKMKATGAADKIALDPAALRKTLLSALPEDLAKKFVDLPITVVPEKEFVKRFGSTSGEAVTILNTGKNGEVLPEVFFKDTGNPLAIREEAVHIAQSADKVMGAKLGQLSEANLAKWDTLGDAQKLQLYRTKIEVEIDAQTRLLQQFAGGDADYLKEVGDTLKELQARLTEVDRAVADPALLHQPGQTPWWDPEQAPRLFAKRRLPATGWWTGAPGNSQWVPLPGSPASSNLKGRTGIDFVGGQPVLDPFSIMDVPVNKMVGNGTDFALADREAARQSAEHDPATFLYRGEPNAAAFAKWRSENGYTWHHSPDCTRMQLILTALHADIPHIGGASLCK